MSDPLECPIDEQNLHSPGADIASDLICLGNGVNEGAILNQQLQSVRNVESDPSTHVQGVYLHSLALNRGRLNLVKVVLSEYGNTTIGELASALQMPREQVFQYIMQWHRGPNGRIIDHLYRRYLNGNSTDRADKIVSLRDARNGVNDEGIPVYHRWRLTTRTNRMLFLPRSNDFEQTIVNNRAALVNREVTSTITELNNAIEATLRIARNFNQVSRRCATIVMPYHQEAGIIDVMAQFMDIARAAPADSINNAGYTNLQNKINDLKEQANVKFATEPTQTAAQLRQQMARLSDQLFYELEDANSTLNQALRQVIVHQNQILPAYINDACQKLGGCYRTLCQGPKAEQFVRDNLIPVLAYLAEQNSGQSPQLTYDRFTSGIGAAAAWVSYIPTLTGNIPGPPSLLLVVVESAVPVAIRLGSVSRSIALTFRSHSIRCLARFMNISDSNLARFTSNMSNPNAEQFMGWRSSLRNHSSRIISSERYTGLYFGVFMSVVSGFLLLNAVCQARTWNEASLSRRIRLIADIAGTGANTLLSLNVALRNSSRIQALISTETAATASKRLGLIGSIAAVISSTIVLVHEFQTRDYTGAGIAILSLSSGLLAVAGWLLIMGGATAWAGIGEVLLVLSFVVALAAAVLSILTGDTNCDAFFEALVENFKDKPLFTRFRNSGTIHGRVLREKFVQVEFFHHRVTIEELNSSARDAMEALLGVDQISNRQNRQDMRDLIDSLID